MIIWFIFFSIWSSYSLLKAGDNAMEDTCTVPVLFDEGRCMTTVSALQYALDLYISKKQQYTPAETQLLLQHAKKAVNTGKNQKESLMYKGSCCFYDNTMSIAKPSLSQKGDFFAFPTIDDIQCVDITTRDSVRYGIKSSHVAFMGEKLVATELPNSGGDQLVIIDFLMLDHNSLRVNLSRKNLKTVSENAKISALDVAAGNTILVADTGNNASSATKISLFDAEKDKTFQTYTSTTKIARNGLKQSPCLNIFGALFHDETNGGCIKIYDLRMQGPTATIYNTCMHNTFDYSGDGSYICSSSSKSKDLMIYTIGQQKVKFSKFKITDPGIITNIYNDYFAVTSYEPSIGSYFATVNVENLVNNVHYQEDVFPQNGEHGILQNLITCKKTGLFLFHYIKNQQTTFFCATANRVYGTTMKYPHPHNIACLYAVQKSARGADIELLRDTKYKSPIDDTIFNDGLFAQVMKEDANT